MNTTRCELCGERFSERDERAEMFDPRSEQPSLVVHAECGIAEGMEVA